MATRADFIIRNKQNSYFSELINSFIDGLDNKGYSNKYTGWDGHPKPWPPEEDI